MNRASRIAVGALAGAAIYFLWGMAAWMALPLHQGTIRSFSDEKVVEEALRRQNPADGLYAIPAYPHSPGGEAPSRQQMDEFERRHRAGPIILAVYHGAGGPPMGTNVFVGGFALDLAAAAISALLVCGAGSCCRAFWQRALIPTSLGLFAGLVAHLAHYNWMWFPWDYSIAMAVDLLIGWTLVGLVQAAIIQPSTGATCGFPTTHEGTT